MKGVGAQQGIYPLHLSFKFVQGLAERVKLADWRGYNEDLQDTYLDPCFAAEGTCNIIDEPYKLNTIYQTF